MIVKYTMSRDARWRGLYGGCGEGGGKGKETDGDGISRPLYLRESLNVSCAYLVKQQTFSFRSTGEGGEGRARDR